MGAAYLNIKRLKGSAIVAIAARHNLREIQAELGASRHIDPARMNDNVLLAGPGTAAEVADTATDIMQRANVGKLRKDAIRALEVLVSLPFDYQENPIGFCRDVLDWITNRFAVPLLSAVIHRDEELPHMHILLLPLVSGRMVGSDLIGGPRRLAELQAGFFKEVAQKHGLSRPAQSQRLNKNERIKFARLALSALQNRPSLLQNAEVNMALISAIGINPEPLLDALGLTPQVNAVENLTRLMIRPVASL